MAANNNNSQNLHSKTDDALRTYRRLNKRSLAYVTGQPKRDTEGVASGSSPTSSASSSLIDLQQSPQLADLYAVLLLGSKDISEEEISIYNAFVKARLERLHHGCHEKADGLSGQSRQHEGNSVSASIDVNNSIASCSSSQQQPILICADGAVVSTAVRSHQAKAACCAGGVHDHTPTSTPPPLPLETLSMAFDALCGDFDSVPPEILLLNGAKENAMNSPSVGHDRNSETAAVAPAVYFHVTALHEDDCRFSSLPASSAGVANAERSSSPSSQRQPAGDSTLPSACLVDSLIASSGAHQPKEGPAAAALSKALKRRRKAVALTVERRGILGKKDDEQDPIYDPTATCHTSSSASSPAPAPSCPALVVKVDCQMTTDFEKCCQLLEMHHLITSAENELAATTVASHIHTPTASAVAVGAGDDNHEAGFEAALALTSGNLVVNDLTIDKSKNVNASPCSDVKPTSSSLPEVLVLGALGGRMDHEFAVLNTLFHYCTRLDMTIFNGKNTLFAVPSNTLMRFERDATRDGDTIGVVVFGAATNMAQTRGLKWELDSSLTCGFGFVQSTSNKIVGLGAYAKRNLTSQVGDGESPNFIFDDEIINDATDEREDCGAEKAFDMNNTFVLDTRKCEPGVFILVTIPRN